MNIFEKEGMYFNVIKAIYDKPVTNIVLNGEKLKPFPLKSETRQECPLSPLIFSPVLEFLARTIKQEKEIQTGKEEVKSSLFANAMIINLKDPKDSTRKTLRYGKVAEYEINIKKLTSFLYTNNKQAGKYIRKSIPFTIASKNT
jgi:hypothetical protein